MIRWRSAEPTDDDDLVAMSLLLHEEDPGVNPMDAARVRRTLATFRREPHRGHAVIAARGDTGESAERVGYALLVPFWSNELGGVVCEVDELYVREAHRSRGVGRALFEAIEDGTAWSEPLVAIALGVTSANARARALYERVGFRAAGTMLVRIPKG